MTIVMVPVLAGQEPVRLDSSNVAGSLSVVGTPVPVGASAAEGGCAVGETADCNGNCAPTEWIGDTYCDDGTYAHNAVPIFFNCDAFGCDGGDCTGPPCTSAGVNSYSVHHLVAETDVSGQTTCYRLFDPAFPGEPDDIVMFDGIPENLATDLLGTVATVTEVETTNPDGTVSISISTASPSFTDLLPGGFTSPDTGGPLIDGCWFIGIDDLLDWESPLTVLSAEVNFLTDSVVVAGPYDLDVAGFFSVPWDGFFAVALAEAAGLGINGIQLDIVAQKGAICGAAEQGDCCAEHISPGCSDAACCEAVCAQDGYCCSNEWDVLCSEAACSLCGDMCSTPPCPADCPGEGDCCEVHGTLGCSDEVCCAAVCEVDPICCITGWDAFCVAQAADVCGAMCPTGACCLDTACEVPGSCEAVVLCGAGCGCFAVAEGGGHCAAGGACDSMVACPNGSRDCPAGQLCYTNTCCAGPVCAPDCAVGASATRMDDAGPMMFRNALAVASRGPTDVCIEAAEGFCTGVSGEYLGDATQCVDPGVCDCPAELPTLIDTTYGCDDSLPRIGHHVLRYFFDLPIPLPVPGEIEIRELLPAGAVGAVDLSELFDFTVEGDSVLRIVEDGCRGGTCDFALFDARCLDGPDVGQPCGQVLENEKWYAVMNNGTWCAAAEFKVDYAVVHGDANNDLVTAFADLSTINVNLMPLNQTPDDSRFDITTTGGISFADLSSTFAKNGSTALRTKPDGHVCADVP